MATEKAIRDAHDHGWHPSVDIVGVSSVFIRVRYRSKVYEQPIVGTMLERVWVDPKFWIALGKARNWKTVAAGEHEIFKLRPVRKVEDARFV